jgi:hypothetical protein
VIEVLHRRCHELERLTVAHDEEPARLSTNVKVERGTAPATGFENSRNGSAADRQRRFSEFHRGGASRRCSLCSNSRRIWAIP